MGFHSYICRLRWNGRQPVLPDDVVQHVSGPSPLHQLHRQSTHGVALIESLTVFGRGAMIGRTVPLWLSDRKLGPINTIILMNVFTLLTVLVVWLPFGALTVPALFVVVLLMGIGTGSFVPLGGM